MKIDFECRFDAKTQTLVLELKKRPKWKIFGSARWHRAYYALLALHEQLLGSREYVRGTFSKESAEIRFHVRHDWFTL